MAEPRFVAPRSVDVIGPAEIEPCLEHILKSDTFRKAPSLRQLLRYLVAQATAGHAEQIKESTIGIQVFGRREDFDSRIDNIVRVQAHRLRKLLDTYYAHEGGDDQILIAIPRGTYVPQFLLRDEPPQAEEPATSIPALPAKSSALEHLPAPRRLFQSRPLLVAALAAMFITGALTGMYLSFTYAARTASQSGPAPDLVSLWGAIFEPGVKVVVAYTNPVFLHVGHTPLYALYQGPISAPSGAEVDVRSFEPNIALLLSKSGPLFFNDGWTGTGEVMSVHRLTTLSTQFKSSFAVVPSRVLSLNEMHGANVIFLGSPWGNGVLSKIGVDDAPFYADDSGCIHDRQVSAGGPKEFRNLANEDTKQIAASYALFSVLPGMDPDRKIVSSAGLSTYATWAGIDLLTTATGIAQLRQSLKQAHGGALPPYFQAVIRTEIIKGSASNTSVVAARVVNAHGRPS